MSLPNLSALCVNFVTGGDGEGEDMELIPERSVRFDPRNPKDTTIFELCTPIPSAFLNEMKRRKVLPFMLYLNNVFYDRRVVGPNPSSAKLYANPSKVSLLAAQPRVQIEAFQVWQDVNPGCVTWECGRTVTPFERQIPIDEETRWVLEYVEHDDPVDPNASFARYCMVPEPVAGTVKERAEACKELIERLWNPQSMNASKDKDRRAQRSDVYRSSQIVASSKKRSLFTFLYGDSESGMGREEWRAYYEQSLPEMQAGFVAWRNYAMQMLDRMIAKAKMEEEARSNGTMPAFEEWEHARDYVGSVEDPLKVKP